MGLPKLTVVIAPRNGKGYGESSATVAKIPETPKKPRRKLSLRTETEIMYMQSVCLMCQKHRRGFVLLPCSHLAVCEKCVSKTIRCPRSDCGEHVTDVIRTYCD